jgi:hypothetical protein
LPGIDHREVVAGVKPFDQALRDTGSELVVELDQ